MSNESASHAPPAVPPTPPRSLKPSPTRVGSRLLDWHGHTWRWSWTQDNWEYVGAVPDTGQAADLHDALANLLGRRGDVCWTVLFDDVQGKDEALEEIALMAGVAQENGTDSPAVVEGVRARLAGLRPNGQPRVPDAVSERGRYPRPGARTWVYGYPEDHEMPEDVFEVEGPSGLRWFLSAANGPGESAWVSERDSTDPHTWSAALHEEGALREIAPTDQPVAPSRDTAQAPDVATRGDDAVVAEAARRLIEASYTRRHDPVLSGGAGVHLRWLASWMHGPRRAEVAEVARALLGTDPTPEAPR